MGLCQLPQFINQVKTGGAVVPVVELDLAAVPVQERIADDAVQGGEAGSGAYQQDILRGVARNVKAVSCGFRDRDRVARLQVLGNPAAYQSPGIFRTFRCRSPSSAGTLASE